MRGRQTRGAVWLWALLLLCAPVVLRAQRELHWDGLDVDARLDAGGVLHVTEIHRMVLTGDWNGGERIFDLRPRQRLSPVSVERIDPATGGRRALALDRRLDEVDEFSWQGGTLRWRSRLPSDPPFSNDRLAYAITYELSGILRHEDDRYRLDHDFAFPERPERAGAIERFSLRLTLDPAWQAMSQVQERYTAGPLAPGQSFVLTVPLRYSGAGTPLAIDTRRSPEIRAAVWAIFLITALAIARFFVRESRLGRFTPVARQPVDTAWITANILALPAEVVGAAWDGAVGTSEVVALMARMVAEGTLTSETAGDASLTMRLNVGRASLQGYELALVDGLFFDGRTVTSTDEVKAHYKNAGFDPAEAIAPGLEARVKEVLPSGRDPRTSWVPGVLLFLGALGLIAYDWYSGGTEMPLPFVVPFLAIVAAAIAQIPGRLFRRRIDWGLGAAVFCLTPALLAAAGTAAFLWFLAGADAIDLSRLITLATCALAVWVVHTSLHALESRQNREAIAFRKKLAAGRRFFGSELQQERPSLQDSWYPWVLAYGLTEEADRWSTRHETSGWQHSTRAHASSSPGTSSPTTSADAAWSGAGGGRSGGAGGGATWAAAAGGMAAGVAAPSSSGGSGGGSSSSGGSSGGGGGGGW